MVEVNLSSEERPKKLYNIISAEPNQNKMVLVVTAPAFPF
jgi:hypothetical protein